MKNNILKGNRGFSLIELLIVMIIIGIIAAIAIPNLLAAKRSANEGTAIGNMRTLAENCFKDKTQCERVVTEYGYVLTIAPGKQGAFVVTGVPETVEGNMRTGDRSFTIFSQSRQNDRYPVFAKLGGNVPTDSNGEGVTKLE